MDAPRQPYAARLEIDYPDRLDRVTTLFRVVLIIPAHPEGPVAASTTLEVLRLQMNTLRSLMSAIAAVQAVARASSRAVTSSTVAAAWN